MGISQPVSIVSISQPVSPYGGSVSPSYLLDEYSVKAAYSIRKVTNKETPLMRVRRSGDNAEQDISNISDALSFCGANTGFVTTWYDQGPSNLHAVQTVAAAQPLICSAGSLYTLSGYNAINFASTTYLSADFQFGTLGTNFGVLTTTYRYDNANRAHFGGNTSAFKMRNAVTGLEIVRNNAAVVLSKPDTTVGLKIAMATYDGALTRLVVNKLSELSTATHINTTVNVTRIGAAGSAVVTEYLVSTMADCIFLNDSSAYPALHQAYLNLYGVV
jgi:hypothetical protein